MVLISRTVWPCIEASAACATSEPKPRVTVRLSITVTSIRSATARAAASAASMVADNEPLKTTVTTPERPSVAACRYISSKAPGEGAAVDGNSSDISQRSQKESVDNSKRSTNSSEPNRILRGTIPMSRSSTMSCGRSQELSVIIFTDVIIFLFPLAIEGVVLTQSLNAF